MTKLPGVGETLDERLEGIDPLVNRTYNNTEYRIYKIPSSTSSNKEKTVYSHYTGYIRISDIIRDYENIMLDSLPHPPVHHTFNFGPTEDGWIGFGTLDGRDHNFTSDGDPLKRDNRLNKEEMVFPEEESIFKITPKYLETSIQEWIDITIHRVVANNI